MVCMSIGTHTMGVCIIPRYGLWLIRVFPVTIPPVLMKLSPLYWPTTDFVNGLPILYTLCRPPW